MPKRSDRMRRRFGSRISPYRRGAFPLASQRARNRSRSKRDGFLKAPASDGRGRSFAQIKKFAAKLDRWKDGSLPLRKSAAYIGGMIYGYARVSTDGQSVTAQVAALTAAGAGKVFRETASGAKTERAQLRRVLAQLDVGDVLMVTRLDRLARSTRDLLNTLAAIADRKAGFRSLGDIRADTTTAHGP
jgi:Resolvase, N terminal domain